MSAARLLPLVVSIAAGVAACAGACWRTQEVWPGPKDPAAVPATAATAVPSGSPAVGLLHVEHPHGAHPRVLLTADRLAVVRGLRAAGAPSWRKLASRCDADTQEVIGAGYEGWDWANASLDLALCHAVTRRPEYARTALAYFRALLDDRNKVGDGAGGDGVVHHDDGYSIRSRGCFGAIAYDWLHDVPGMTPDLRKHAVDRIVAWTKWFGDEGYNREEPIANYYAGYFGAVAFGGIAAEGDDPRARDLLRLAERMFNSDLVPTYRKKLAGGDFPEGWQYGDMVGAILAMFVDAESRQGGSHSLYDDLSWLRESVAYRAHALWPDGKHMLDTGDWSDKPAVAPAHALLALSTVLPANDPAERRAHALARLADDPHEEWLWLAAVADDPSHATEDPRAGETSYLATGTGTLVARTDGSPQAVWMFVSSAPSLSDHQHLDAGHFELVRGADALVVDAGGYGSYSSLSHNVIAVDDKKENDTYAPSQGTWGARAGIVRHEDTPRYTYGLADYTSAYDPPGYPDDHPARSVVRAEREIVFSRSPVHAAPESARFVVYDRVTLSNPAYAATFLLHGGSAPQARDGGTRFVVGRSAALAKTLLPVDLPPVFVREPTDLGDGPYYANEPPEGVTSMRVEVRSRPSDVERRFLHAIVVGPSDMPASKIVRIDGDGIDGAAVDDEAYTFSRGGPQLRPLPFAYTAPLEARRHVIASLVPKATYDVEASRDRGACRIEGTPGTGRAASAAGVLTVEIEDGCAIAPPR